MVRVWFNHWFSTSYRLIELMKQDSEEVYVIGSNTQKDSVIQLVCDEWYEEPRLDGEEYIEYCLAFCKEHKIDVFVPRRKMVEISKNRARFESIQTRVMVDDYETIEILNDKVKAYDLFADLDCVKIPEYHLVNDVNSFEKAYESLKENHDRICIKFVRDEGGMSFRKIVDKVDKFAKLRMYPGSDVAYDELVEVLKEQGEFDDLMVMPYLPGDEISVDCLDTSDGLIAIPRVKGNARHEYVDFDEHILNMTRKVMEKVKLKYPCNIQFKIKDDIPYLLEINTRMSGGLQMSCLAADVNIPNIALNKILGKRTDWSMDTGRKTVSYIEIPKIIC